MINKKKNNKKMREDDDYDVGESKIDLSYVLLFLVD